MPSTNRATAAARQVVAHLESEIATTEGRLAEVRSAYARWAPIFGEKGGKRPQMRATPRVGPEVDWSKVYASLPKSFTSALVAKRTPELEAHKLSRNIGIARWVRSGLVKKLGPGRYEKKSVRR